MQFRTPIDIPKHRFIELDSTFVLLGSCFAEHIGRKLIEYRFAGAVNLFGVLYNPLSIAQALERLLVATPFVESELFLHEGLYHSWAHHGSFSHADARKALELMNCELQHGAELLQKADVLCLTFGSSWVYEHNGSVVANCHRVPNNQFVRRRLTIDEIVEQISSVFEKIFEKNQNIQIILSVSPIRYMRGAIPENQTNKAVLLLATEALCRRFAGRVHYFPAYEIVLDELRDYRFFADDMIHPSNSAIEYVWQRFVETYFTEKTCAALPAIEHEIKRANHRPIHYNQ